MNMSAVCVQKHEQQHPCTETKIVHNRFRMMKLATEGVDKVRRQEHRQLKQGNDNRLAGTKHLWLTNQENLSDSQHERFNAAYNRQLETGTAWAFNRAAERPVASTFGEARDNVFLALVQTSHLHKVDATEKGNSHD